MAARPARQDSRGGWRAARGARRTGGPARPLAPAAPFLMYIRSGKAHCGPRTSPTLPPSPGQPRAENSACQADYARRSDYPPRLRAPPRPQRFLISLGRHVSCGWHAREGRGQPCGCGRRWPVACEGAVSGRHPRARQGRAARGLEGLLPPRRSVRAKAGADDRPLGGRHGGTAPPTPSPSRGRATQGGKPRLRGVSYGDVWLGLYHVGFPCAEMHPSRHAPNLPAAQRFAEK